MRIEHIGLDCALDGRKCLKNGNHQQRNVHHFFLLMSLSLLLVSEQAIRVGAREGSSCFLTREKPYLPRASNSFRMKSGFSRIVLLVSIMPPPHSFLENAKKILIFSSECGIIIMRLGCHASEDNGLVGCCNNSQGFLVFD